jgi:uncharacterized membrane protein YccC
MKIYLKTFLITVVLVPVFFHVLAPEEMPWWPDAASMGIASGAVAAVLVWKTRAERETNQRLWNALKTLVRHWASR